MNEAMTPKPEPQEQEAVTVQRPGGELPPLDLEVAKLTDVGRARPHNEDYVDYYVPPDPQLLATKGSIYLVADGMGGHQAGEVASQGAVELAISQYYADTAHDIGASLVRAFRAANQQIQAQAQADPSKAGMGTTLVAAVILERKVYVVNVGDSRAYLVNSQGITQITEDHSWVEEQVRAKLLTPEQARRHPQRNLVTRALGSKPDVQVDLFEGDLSAGDMILLCSDGLTGRVEDREIAALMKQYPPQEAAQKLIDLANERGGNDNITVLIVSAQEEAATVVAAPPPPPPPKKKEEGRSPLIPILVGLAAILVLVLGGLVGAKFVFLPATATVTPAPATITVSPTILPATATPPEAQPLPTIEITATLTATPTMTGAVPTATLSPTVVATNTPLPTDAPAAPSATPTPTATPEPAYPAPDLQEPAPDAELSESAAFKWQRTGPALAQDHYFDLRIWSEKEAGKPKDQRRGAAKPVKGTEIVVNDLKDVPAIKQYGVGVYYWTVVVVEKTPDQQYPRVIGQWGEERKFVYTGPPSGPGSGPKPTKDPCANFVCTEDKCCGATKAPCCAQVCPAFTCP